MHLLSESVSLHLDQLKKKLAQEEAYHQECSQLVDSAKLQLDQQYDDYRSQEKRLVNEKNKVEVLKNEGQMKYDEVRLAGGGIVCKS